MDSVFSLVVVVIICILIYIHLKRRNKYFKNLNIPGPEPQLIFGNLLQVMKTACMHDTLQEWTKKYGKFFGYMEGGTPVLVISDPDMVHEVFVKKFSSFNARKALPIQPDPDTDKNIHMFLARGLRWKRLRAIANPTFTTSKLKQMSVPMRESVESILNRLKSHSAKQEPFDIYPLYQSLTLDVISRCAFGLHSDCQSNDENYFLLLCKQVFADTFKLSPINYLAIFFPELAPFWRKVHFMTERIRQNPFLFLEDKLKEILKLRKQLSQNANVTSKPNDLLQLLLDSEASDVTLDTFDTSLVPGPNGATEPQKLSKKMSLQEIVSTCILFMLAGYETTSTALAYTTYLLATHPDVQRKLQDEIDELNIDSPGSVELIVKAPYLEMVMSESLRLYPIAQPITARTCIEPCSIGPLTVHARQAVLVDVWSIHSDPSVWGADVSEFRPERFSPEESAHRHPMAWLPFGAGPRNCIGMRFGLMEAKITLAQILSRYNFKICPQTEVLIPLRLCEGATCTPKNGVHIVLEKRS